MELLDQIEYLINNCTASLAYSDEKYTDVCMQANCDSYIEVAKEVEKRIIKKNKDIKYLAYIQVRYEEMIKNQKKILSSKIPTKNDVLYSLTTIYTILNDYVTHLVIMCDNNVS